MKNLKDRNPKEILARASAEQNSDENTVAWRIPKDSRWSSEKASKEKKVCENGMNKETDQEIHDLQRLFPDLAAAENSDEETVLFPVPNSVHWSSEKVPAKKKPCGNGVCRKLVQGVNDLQTLFPDIATEWNVKRNGDLLPSQVCADSRKKVWWICPSGHEWMASIQSRTKYSHGCPYDSGKFADFA